MSTLHFKFWPKELPRTLALPETSVYHNLVVSTARYPQRPVLHYYGRSMTYAVFFAEVEALAGHLQQRCGVARGDRVLLFMQNSPQFMVAFYAILRIDAVVVPINPMNLANEVRWYAGDSQARTALVGQELYAQVQPLVADGTLDHVVVANYADYLPETSPYPLPDVLRKLTGAVTDSAATAWPVALAAGAVPSPHRSTAEDIAIILYTSGTTGRPKGCVHTHRSTQATLIGGAVAGNAVPDNVILCAVPMFHVTGMQHCLNLPVYVGASTVIMTRWDREAAGQMIRDYRVTGWTNIPTMVIDLLASPNMARFDLSTLTRIGGGGAAMPEAVAHRLRELTGLDYLEGYGMSETMSQTHWNPTHRPKAQCLGIPTFDTESRVVDPDTLAPLGPGEVGEIISSGPQLMREYWRNPAATAEAIVTIDGRRFMRTGDLGRYDEEGYFFIQDRLKRMINAAGFKVWPAEVESSMYRNPDIQEACVIGTYDARKGEAVKAVVVLKPDAVGRVTAEDIIGWCRQNMAAYKVPSQVEFVDALPKSGTGKIQWRMLQEQETARSQGTS